MLELVEMFRAFGDKKRLVNEQILLRGKPSSRFLAGRSQGKTIAAIELRDVSATIGNPKELIRCRPGRNEPPPLPSLAALRQGVATPVRGAYDLFLGVCHEMHFPKQSRTRPEKPAGSTMREITLPKNRLFSVAFQPQ
jgi:hypothetical protein